MPPPLPLLRATPPNSRRSRRRPPGPAGLPTAQCAPHRPSPCAKCLIYAGSAVSYVCLRFASVLAHFLLIHYRRDLDQSPSQQPASAPAQVVPDHCSDRRNLMGFTPTFDTIHDNGRLTDQRVETPRISIAARSQREILRFGGL